MDNCTNGSLCICQGCLVARFAPKRWLARSGNNAYEAARERVEEETGVVMLLALSSNR